MSKNTGKAYEKLTKEIYQAFCNFDTNENGFKKVEVLHNVIIQGKSKVAHQIDVFWEFNLAGVNYKTLVEVKDWKKPVEKEQILSFKTKIDDIPNSNGIFVSRSGFQEGAIEFAQYSGIQLITITESKEYRVLLNYITTNYADLQIQFDVDELNELPISVNCLVKFLFDESYENLIVIRPDKNPEKIFDLMCLDAKPYYYTKDNVTHYIEKEFDDEWYIVCRNTNIPLLRIYGYKFRCYNTSEKIMITINNLPIVIIKNIINGNERHYNKSSKSILDI